MITSHCTGWDPNPAEYAIADNIMGPWQAKGNPCIGPGAELTFNSQGTFVFNLAERADYFIFMADRWNKMNLKDSRYVWLPIEILGEKISIQNLV